MIVKGDKRTRDAAASNGGRLGRKPSKQLRRRRPSPRLGARVGYEARSLIVAVVLALAAMVLILSYVRGYKADVQGGAQDVTVLVAARDIPAGTDARELGTDAFQPRTIPRRLLVPGALTSVDQIGERVLKEPIYAGEQVSLRRLAVAEAGGTRAQLTGNLRAMRVTGKPDQVLSGILEADDRVDVIASVRPTGAGQRERPAARVILRGLLVLEVDDVTGEGGSGVERGAGAPGVLLALTDAQAQRLFFATRNGEWSLVLRAPTEPADSPEDVTTAESLIGEGGAVLP